MDKVMDYINGIEWDNLLNAARTYFESLNIPQVITDIANFFNDIFKVIFGG